MTDLVAASRFFFFSLSLRRAPSLQDHPDAPLVQASQTTTSVCTFPPDPRTKPTGLVFIPVFEYYPRISPVETEGKSETLPCSACTLDQTPPSPSTTNQPSTHPIYPFTGVSPQSLLLLPHNTIHQPTSHDLDHDHPSDLHDHDHFATTARSWNENLAASYLQLTPDNPLPLNNSRRNRSRRKRTQRPDSLRPASQLHHHPHLTSAHLNSNTHSCAMLLPSAMACDPMRPIPLPRYRLFSPPPETSSPVSNGLLGTCRALQSLLCSSPAPQAPLVHRTRPSESASTSTSERRLQSPAPLSTSAPLRLRKVRKCSAVTTAPINPRRKTTPKRIISQKRSLAESFSSDVDLSDDSDKEDEEDEAVFRGRATRRSSRPHQTRYLTPKRQRCNAPPVMPMGLSRSDFESLGFESPSDFISTAPLAKEATPTIVLPTSSVSTTLPLQAPGPITPVPRTLMNSFPFNLALPLPGFSHTASQPKTPTPHYLDRNSHHTPPSSVSPPSLLAPPLIHSARASQAATIPDVLDPSVHSTSSTTWEAKDDALLVSLVLSKLNLTSTQLNECAAALGKDPSAIGDRWKDLVLDGEVGLRNPPMRKDGVIRGRGEDAEGGRKIRRGRGSGIGRMGIWEEWRNE